MRGTAPWDSDHTLTIWITHLALGSRSVLMVKAAVTDKETESLYLVFSRGSVVRRGKLLWHFKVLSSLVSSEVTS